MVGTEDNDIGSPISIDNETQMVAAAVSESLKDMRNNDGQIAPNNSLYSKSVSHSRRQTRGEIQNINRKINQYQANADGRSLSDNGLEGEGGEDEEDQTIIQKDDRSPYSNMQSDR